MLLAYCLFLSCGCTSLPPHEASLRHCPDGGQEANTKVDEAICTVLRHLSEDESLYAPGRDLSVFSTPRVRVDRVGRIEGYVRVGASTLPMLEALRRAGMEIVVVRPNLRLVQGWIPYHAIDAIAGLSGVERIAAPVYGQPK